MAKDKKLTISGISVPVKRTPFAEWVAKNENLPLAIYEQAVQRLLGLTMLQMNAKSPDPVHDAEGAGWIRQTGNNAKRQTHGLAEKRTMSAEQVCREWRVAGSNPA